MNALYVCQTCGGLYTDVQPDGMLYFHTCPFAYDAKLDVLVVRPDARDENIRLRGDGKIAGVKADGRGVKLAINGTAVKPAWQLKLAAQLAKEE